MPRPRRIQLEEKWYHVFNRGASRQKIFLTKADYQMFIDCAVEIFAAHSIEIHCYCLMGNHYHLLVYTNEPALSDALRDLSSIYTRKFNKAHGRDGPLFRSRFKSKLVEDDYYQLYLTKYIHRNPLEAKMLKNLEEYEWSSFKYYLNPAEKPEWLNVDIILSHFNSKMSTLRSKNYQEFVLNLDETSEEKYLSTTYTNIILGSDEYRHSILKVISQRKGNDMYWERQTKKSAQKPSIEKIIEICSNYYSIDLNLVSQDKLNLGRLIAMYISRKRYGYKTEKISDVFNCTISSVTTSIHRITQKLDVLENDIAEIIEQCHGGC